MLQEFTTVKQEPGAHGRRWFQAAGWDLIVWLDAQQQPTGFQICYIDALRREHALTWRPETGFTHARVDGGDTRPDKNLTPVLVSAGPVAWEKLSRDFETRSAQVDPALRDFVLGRLREGGA